MSIEILNDLPLVEALRGNKYQRNEDAILRTGVLYSVIISKEVKAMALLEEIKQKIDSLGDGEFQTLCDAYLSSVGYQDLVSLGTKSGTKKTTKGTPDAYIPLSNGKYIFVEYTTQKTKLAKKIIADLQKCFNEDETGIKCSDIAKVLYFHTSSNITPKQDKEIQNYSNIINVPVELTGIDKFANILYRDHKCLVEMYLGIPISTDQIFTKGEFVQNYDKAPTAAPLKTSFMFREKEIENIKATLSEYNTVLISGDAGIGKTRLALELPNNMQENTTSSSGLLGIITKNCGVILTFISKRTEGILFL